MSDYFLRGTCGFHDEPQYFHYGTATSLAYTGPRCRRFINESVVATRADIRRIVREELERAKGEP